MNKIKAIIIDPVQLGTITEVEIENSLKGLQMAIGDKRIELVRLDADNDLFVDEEGLFVDDQSFFHLDRPYPMDLAGKAVVVGNTPQGDQSDVKLSIETIRKMVIFQHDE